LTGLKQLPAYPQKTPVEELAGYPLTAKASRTTSSAASKRGANDYMAKAAGVGEVLSLVRVGCAQ